MQRIASGARLWSGGVSDTKSILDKRIRLMVGVRWHTAGTELLDGRVPTNNRACAESSAWTPAYAIVVKPIENLSFYVNDIEGLQARMPIILRANIENLLNKSCWASASSGVITVGAPRTYLVLSTFNF